MDEGIMAISTTLKYDWGGQSADVIIGPDWVGVVESYDVATRVLTALGNLAKMLPNEEPIKSLVEMYFDLKDHRDQCLENLAPVVVEKWLVDGHCEWCPSSD